MFKVQQIKIFLSWMKIEENSEHRLRTTPNSYNHPYIYSKCFCMYYPWFC